MDRNKKYISFIDTNNDTDMHPLPKWRMQYFSKYIVLDKETKTVYSEPMGYFLDMLLHGIKYILVVYYYHNNNILTKFIQKWTGANFL